MPLSNIGSNASASSISYYSTKGDKSVKLVPIDTSASSGTWLRWKINDFTDEAVTLKLSVDIKAVNCGAKLYLQLNVTGSSATSNNISIPLNGEGNYSVTLTTPADINSVQIQVGITDLSYNSACYIDNINLIES